MDPTIFFWVGSFTSMQNFPYFSKAFSGLAIKLLALMWLTFFTEVNSTLHQNVALTCEKYLKKHVVCIVKISLNTVIIIPSSLNAIPIRA